MEKKKEFLEKALKKYNNLIEISWDELAKEFNIVNVEEAR